MKLRLSQYLSPTWLGLELGLSLAKKQVLGLAKFSNQEQRFTGASHHLTKYEMSKIPDLVDLNIFLLKNVLPGQIQFV